MDENVTHLTVSYPNHHKVFTERIWTYFTTKHKLDLNLVHSSGSIGVHQLIVELLIPTLTNFIHEADSFAGHRQNTDKFRETNILDLELSLQDDASQHDLELLIELVYRGSVRVTIGQLESLRRTADKLSVPFQVISDVPCSATSTSTLTTNNKYGSGGLEVRTHKLIKRQKVSAAKLNKRKALNPTKLVRGIISRRLCSIGANGATNTPEISNQTKQRLARSTNKECNRSKVIVKTKFKTANSNVPESHTGDVALNQETDIEPQDLGIIILPRETGNFKVTDEKSSNSDEARAKVSPTKKTKSRAEYRKQWRLQQPLLKCDLCTFETRDKRLLVFHQNAKHDVEAFVFRCEICARPFQKSESLERHLLTHADDRDIYRCKHCDYTSTKKVNYFRHLTENHKITPDGNPVEERFRCTDCAYTSNFKSRFARHVQTKHNNKKAFHCELCPYESARREHVKGHMRSVHQKIRDYVCDRCGHAAGTAGALSTHKRTHTGEKRYKCPICGKCYSQNNKLKTHLQLHENPNEKSFFCHLCGHGTRRRDNLQEHLKRIHKTTLDAESLQ